MSFLAARMLVVSHGGRRCLISHLVNLWLKHTAVWRSMRLDVTSSGRRIGGHLRRVSIPRPPVGHMLLGGKLTGCGVGEGGSSISASSGSWGLSCKVVLQMSVIKVLRLISLFSDMGEL